MKTRSLHDQIADKCIHFNGIQHKSCKAGMVYDDLDKENRIEYRAGLPCFKSDSEIAKRLGGRPQCHCQHVQFPTEEDVQKQIAEHEQSMKKFTVALVAVKPIREKYKGQDWGCIIECPVCNGKLHVTHAAYNGHVHAKCETPDCVAWIE